MIVKKLTEQMEHYDSVQLTLNGSTVSWAKRETFTGGFWTKHYYIKDNIIMFALDYDVLVIFNENIPLSTGYYKGVIVDGDNEAGFDFHLVEYYADLPDIAVVEEGETYTVLTYDNTHAAGSYEATASTWQFIGGLIPSLHSSLSGLDEDDHTEYLNNTRGDARYYNRTSFKDGYDPISGTVPLKTNNSTGTLGLHAIPDGINHSNLGNLEQDDHTHYIHTNGSRDMDASYTPSNDQSVSTKKYVDHEVDSSVTNKVKVDTSDSASGYLDDKITVTGLIDKTIDNVGANENIQFSISNNVFDKSSDNLDDIENAPGPGSKKGYEIANSPFSTDIIKNKLISESIAKDWNDRITDIEENGLTCDNTVEVSTNGNCTEFASIQSAIDSITDASSTNPYSVIIHPGIYTENITMKKYVSILGTGADNRATTITNSAGTIVTLPTDGSCDFNDLTIEATGSAKAISIGSGSTYSYSFIHCHVDVTATNTYKTGITLTSGTINFMSSGINYTNTGSGGGTHCLFDITGNASLQFNNSDISASVDTGGDDLIVIRESNYSISMYLLHSVLRVYRSGVITGDTIAYQANGTSSNKMFLASFILLVCQGTGGTAYAISTLNNGCTIYSTGSRYNVTNFSNDYLAMIDENDTLNLHFDDVVALNCTIGNGTINKVYSKTDGNLDISRDLMVERNTTVSGEIQLASGVPISEISNDVTLSGDSIAAVVTEHAIKSYIEAVSDDYILKDGSVAFTAPVAGQTPTLNSHLSTKGYVDSVAVISDNDLGPVIDKDLTEPPSGSISIGDKYIIAGTSGDWSTGTIDDVVEYVSGTPNYWDFTTPVGGNTAWVSDEGIDYTYSAGNWGPTGATISHLSIQDTGIYTHTQIDSHIDDTSNPHSIDKSDVSLGNVTNDAQLKRSSNDFNNGISEKTINDVSDRFLIEDANDSYSKKYIKAENTYDRKVQVSSNDTVNGFLSNKLIGTSNKITVTEVGDGGDEDLQIDVGSHIMDTNVAGQINGLTVKTEPTAVDELVIEDSADSNNKKKIQVGNIPLATTQVTATTQASTTSATYEVMTSMTSTPTAGTYLVMFSGSGYGSVSGQESQYAIHVDGTIEQHTERDFIFQQINNADSLRRTLHTQAVVTVNGSQAIDIRWLTSTGVFYAEERSLILLKVG